MSYDSRTRFHIDHFLDVLKNGKSHVPVVSAGSMLEVRKIVDGWQNKISKRLLFRGQTGSYPTVRKHPNPFFQFEHFGEVSLVPSLWREMLKTKPDHYPSFEGLGPLDWSAVIYDQFDMPEIERRHKALLDAGEWIYSAQDMADSDDPLLQEWQRKARPSRGIRHGNFLQRVGPAETRKLQERVAAELKTTFASHYTRVISLQEALQPDVLAAYNKRATGEKYLINPNKA